MQFDPDEIDAIAEALAPRVAGLLAERLEQQPEWAFSVSQAAAWAQVEPHVIRDAISDGRLPAVRLGRQVRIRRSDLFAVRNGQGGGK